MPPPAEPATAKRNLLEVRKNRQERQTIIDLLRESIFRELKMTKHDVKMIIEEAVQRQVASAMNLGSFNAVREVAEMLDTIEREKQAAPGRIVAAAEAQMRNNIAAAPSMSNMHFVDEYVRQMIAKEISAQIKLAAADYVAKKLEVVVGIRDDEGSIVGKF